MALKRIYKKFFFVIILSFFIYALNSCNKENEEDTTVISTTIIGEWKCNDNASENGLYDTQSYTIDLSKNDSIYCISNFGNIGINADANAEINGLNINIPEQTVDDIIVHGYGTFTNNNKTVNFTYFLDNEKIESVWNKN